MVNEVTSKDLTSQEIKRIITVEENQGQNQKEDQKVNQMQVLN